MIFTIEQANEQVRVKKALENLMENGDFKLVFQTHYGEKQVQALGYLLTQAANERQEKERSDKLKAIFYFKQFMQDVLNLGTYAEEQLKNPETYEALGEKDDG